MMPAEEPRGLDRFVAAGVHSADGEDIGRVARFLPHRITGLPTWMVVMKLPSTRQFILPVAGCEFNDDGVVTPYAPELVAQQPDVDIEDGVLSPEAETLLDAHFGLGSGEDRREPA